MTGLPPFRPAGDRLVAGARARSRTERSRALACELDRSEYAFGGRARALAAQERCGARVRPLERHPRCRGAGWGLYLSGADVGRLAGGYAIRRVALNLAREAERA